MFALITGEAVHLIIHLYILHKAINELMLSQYSEENVDCNQIGLSHG